MSSAGISQRSSTMLSGSTSTASSNTTSPALFSNSSHLQLSTSLDLLFSREEPKIASGANLPPPAINIEAVLGSAQHALKKHALLSPQNTSEDYKKCRALLQGSLALLETKVALLNPVPAENIFQSCRQVVHIPSIDALRKYVTQLKQAIADLNVKTSPPRESKEYPPVVPGVEKQKLYQGNIELARRIKAKMGF